MEKRTVYGLPLSPEHLLEELEGASFCVSYGTRKRLGGQLKQAIRLVGEDGLLLVDNGAFSNYKAGGSSMDEGYLAGYEAWATKILERCPQAVAVIPDVIGGTEEQNRQLAHETMLDTDRAMFVWHLNESLAQLTWACESFQWIAFGSAGEYWQIGTAAWHKRIGEAFAAIEAWELETGNLRPRIHMMRAQSLAHLYPFDSADSVNVAINHCRYKGEGPGHVERLAGRIDARIQASAGPATAAQVARPIRVELEPALPTIAAAVAEAMMALEDLEIPEPGQLELDLAA